MTTSCLPSPPYCPLLPVFPPPLQPVALGVTVAVSRPVSPPSPPFPSPPPPSFLPPLYSPLLPPFPSFNQQVAYATTVAVRFANNVVGGENFIDMARWAGVQ